MLHPTSVPFDLSAGSAEQQEMLLPLPMHLLKTETSTALQVPAGSSCWLKCVWAMLRTQLGDVTQMNRRREIVSLLTGLAGW